MHLLVRDATSLDEAEPAVDLGLAPADVLFLSFSDSDLNAAASALAQWPEAPSARLVNLARLRHPMSVDLWLEQTAAHARAIVLRILGGLDYWRYGAEEVAALARRQGIPLAMVAGDARPDARLAELSTVAAEPLARLDALLRHGGTQNLRAALALAASLGGIGTGLATTPTILPAHGEFAFGAAGPPDAVILFYRAWLLADDIAPLHDLARALQARGLAVRGIFVASLKDDDDARFVAATLRDWRPAVVLNATGFSARGEAGSPLDAADAPVLQLVLSGSRRAAWQADARGLSATDLAMQVVLPELDGRLLTTAISFKEPAEPDATLQFARVLHAPDADGIALAADRAAGWARLAQTPRAGRRIAIVLSDYPDVAGQSAYAVGLDTLASLACIIDLLNDSGYAIGTPPDLAMALCQSPPSEFITLARYEALFATLPEEFRARVLAAWGAPRGEEFVLRHVMLGNALLAIQPDRGDRRDRKAAYHDPATPPRHAYIAFHLWLRTDFAAHALLHLGTHGTLEWLPGKAAALSANCDAVVLQRGLPVIYPYIVSNPGEAAAAKRRLGALTIGHLTPPLGPAAQFGAAAELERLIDDYAAADGLDARRGALLRQDILLRANESGMLAECGIDAALPEFEQLAKLDAFLCDVKNLRVRDGLHVFATAPQPAQRNALLAALIAACPDFTPDDLANRLDASAKAEETALLAALDARFVAPGPAGAPTRGRADVLPTGRNLTTLDPRAVPTRAALVLAERAAEALLRRHLQDHGNWPRALVLDLWGSATMRTGGEDLALALVLLGARPLWEAGSARVTGVDILPLAMLDRPRIDVTLRISGLFRDAFPAQIALFDQAVQAIAERDEADDWNPLAAAARGRQGIEKRLATARIFGTAPGDYGSGAATHLDRGDWQAQDTLGRAWLDASSHAYGAGLDGVAAAESFAARIAAADAFLHVQDNPDTDILDGTEHAAHEGGFAAAAAHLGATPALYHADTTAQDTPRIRTMAEEVARVARGRAGNPAWVAAMLRHGWRGGSEVARALDGLHGFAATLPTRFDRQFDLVFDATLGDAATDAALRAANPAAHEAMRARFREALRRGLWRPRRNDVARLGESE